MTSSRSFDSLDALDAQEIILTGVKTHNLKDISVRVPKAKLTVITGVSGSGKSSLAFDTLFAEGQRRYTESLSTYVRQFLEQMKKPPLDAIENLPPALALSQKNSITNPRSTVGTVSEINDHLQLLFARAGITHCPHGHGVVRRDTVMSTVESLQQNAMGQRILLYSLIPIPEPVHRGSILRQLIQDGYRRLYVDKRILEIDDPDSREEILGLTAFPVLIDRFSVSDDSIPRIAEAIEGGFHLGKGTLTVVFWDQPERPEHTFNHSFKCNFCEEVFVQPTPNLFQFTNSLGACPYCGGTGRAAGIDMRRVIPNHTLTIIDGAVDPLRLPSQRAWQKKLIEGMKSQGYPIDIPYRRLPEAAKTYIRKGKRGTEWLGIDAYFKHHGSSRRRFSAVLMARYRGYDRCEACEGSRLASGARNVTFYGKRIHEFWDIPIHQCFQWFEELELLPSDAEAIGLVVDEIRQRLRTLVQIGVSYLTLGRPSSTLSGGEMQRVHLITSIGRALTDTLYVLDEPTAGLHAVDSQRLLQILYNLRDLGNTVVVVEHDPEIIEGADAIIEIGPGAGHCGGSLIFQGSLNRFLTQDSLTSRLLRHRPVHTYTQQPPPSGYLSIRGACGNNLKDLDVDFPLNRLTVVTGVSGSGKSTLVMETLYRQFLHHQGLQGVEAAPVQSVSGFELLEAVELMDQNALGRSTRSNAMTYTHAYDEIRKLFSSTSIAKKRGVTSRDFSINVKGGRCDDCDGLGVQTIEMHFMADVEVECETCQGRRFQQRILDVDYHGKSISDIFELTVEQGIEFFIHSPKIVQRLTPLVRVGLGYLRLGQSTSTLSGGEAQRLKLAAAMMEPEKGTGGVPRTLYIFDEPTVGLHLQDVQVLLVALRQLVDAGHTVVVVEHNLDFIANADYIIDLGPGPGEEGGQLVAAGTPPYIETVRDSITGEQLRRMQAEATAPKSSELE